MAPGERKHQPYLTVMKGTKMSTDTMTGLLIELDSSGWVFQSLTHRHKRRQWVAVAMQLGTGRICSAFGPDHISALSHLQLSVQSRNQHAASLDRPNTNSLANTEIQIHRSTQNPTVCKPNDSTHKSISNIHALDAENLKRNADLTPKPLSKSAKKAQARAIVKRDYWRVPDRPVGRSKSDLAIQLGVTRRKVDEVARRLGFDEELLSDSEARHIIVELQ
jgi:hypothetical protein